MYLSWLCNDNYGNWYSHSLSEKKCEKKSGYEMNIYILCWFGWNVKKTKQKKHWSKFAKTVIFTETKYKYIAQNAQFIIAEFRIIFLLYYQGKPIIFYSEWEFIEGLQNKSNYQTLWILLFNITTQ